MAIIEDVERRLRNWAEWKRGGLSGGLGYARSSLHPLAALLRSKHGCSSSAAIVQSDEPVLTDQAVRSLPADLQAVVSAWYLDGHRTTRDIAERLGLCQRTLMRRRDEAHLLISRWFSSRASERRYSRERGV